MTDEPVYYHFEIDGKKYTIKEGLGILVFNPSGVERLTVNGRFDKEADNGNGK
jgi:hypothetical protein